MNLFSSCVKNHVDRFFFILRVWGEPALIIVEGRVLSYSNHYYFLDCGGQQIKRHEEEVWQDEDLAYRRLAAAYQNWQKFYE